MPLEDAVDLVDFVEVTGRTIPRIEWAEECIEAAKQPAIEKMLG